MTNNTNIYSSMTLGDKAAKIISMVCSEYREYPDWDQTQIKNLVRNLESAMNRHLLTTTKYIEKYCGIYENYNFDHEKSFPTERHYTDAIFFFERIVKDPAYLEGKEDMRIDEHLRFVLPRRTLIDTIRFIRDLLVYSPDKAPTHVAEVLTLPGAIVAIIFLQKTTKLKDLHKSLRMTAIQEAIRHRMDLREEMKQVMKNRRSGTKEELCRGDALNQFFDSRAEEGADNIPPVPQKLGDLSLSDFVGFKGKYQKRYANQIENEMLVNAYTLHIFESFSFRFPNVDWRWRAKTWVKENRNFIKELPLRVRNGDSPRRIELSKLGQRSLDIKKT